MQPFYKTIARTSSEYFRTKKPSKKHKINILSHF